MVGLWLAVVERRFELIVGVYLQPSSKRIDSSAELRMNEEGVYSKTEKINFSPTYMSPIPYMLTQRFCKLLPLPQYNLKRQKLCSFLPNQLTQPVG
jgi:hypothetical protein